MWGGAFLILLAVGGCGSAETMSTVSQAIVVASSIVTAAAGGGALYFGKKYEREKNAATAAREAEGAEREAELKVQVDGLVNKADKIQATADAVQAQLRPFEELARTLHPTLPTDEALEKLQGDIERLKGEVETERAARAELQEKLRPRQLLSSEADAIRKAVKELGPCPRFTIQTSIGDAEAQAYAEQIGRAFAAAGCDMSGSGVDTGVSANAVGLFIAIPPQQAGPVPANAQWLVEVLTRAGLKFQITTRSMMTGNLQLIIGGKPK